MDRGRARRVPHRRPPDGRGLLRAVQAGAHGVPHERPGPPPVGAAPGEAERYVGRAADVGDLQGRRAREGDPGGGPGRRAGGPDPAPAAAQGRARGARGSGSLHPRRTRLHDVATHILCGARARRPALLDADGPTGNADFDEAASALREAGEAAVVIAGERLADAAGRRRGRRWRWRSRRARASPTSRAGRTTAARCAPACTRACCPGGRTRRGRARRGRGRVGPGDEPRARPRRARHPPGLRGRRDRRPVPRRRGPAARRHRRRPRAARAPERALQGRCSRWSSDRWSPSPTRSCPPRRSWRRRATSPTGRAAASDAAGPRGRGHLAARLGDLREHGARVRRRPRVRDARGAARGDGRACWRRARSRWRSAPPSAASRAADGPPALHLPAAGRRGPAVRARRRAEGGAGRQEPFVEVHPDDAAALGLVDGGHGRACARRRARPSCRCASPTHVARGVGVRAVQPGRVRGEHAALRLVHHRGHARAGRAPAEVAPEARRPTRRCRPDGLGRLGAPGRPRGRSCSSRC